ncbi:MAG: hypothetical protein IKO41_17560 [Lachnospiraceae bacterium]|nr:hypothetical protein [Lachnospiraceae bacterium]
MISINDLIENSVDCTMLVIEYYGMTEIPERKKEIWNSIIALLPNAWLQRRILSLNYAVLQNMLTMRKNHSLQNGVNFVGLYIRAWSIRNFFRIHLANNQQRRGKP